MADLRLGLGGAGLGNHRVDVGDGEAHDVLAAAWAQGVRLFDTAPHYGLGLSERRIGTFIAGLPRADLRVSTKVGRRLEPVEVPGAMDDEGFLVPATACRVWDFSEAGIRRTLVDSLERLGLERVDTAYLHDPERHDLDEALAEGLPALRLLKDEGLVGRIGVASMDLDALLAAAGTGQVDELMVAGRYTLVDRRAEQQLLPLCAGAGVNVVAAAVFNGGLLAGTPDRSSTYDYAAVPHDVLATALEIDAACRRHGVPIAAAALQFPLRHPVVTDVVVGAVEPEQVRDNADLLQTVIPEQLWAELDALAARGGRSQGGSRD